MLNLKKLEDRLNESLENETRDSLMLWIFQKRLRSFLENFNNVDFFNKIVKHDNISRKNNIIENKEIVKIAGNCEIALAA